MKTVLFKRFEINVCLLHVLSLLVPLRGNSEPLTLRVHHLVVTVTSQFLGILGIEHKIYKDTFLLSA